MAQELDAERPTVDFSKKPLFGLPISVKDLVMVKGTDSTAGLEKLVNKPSDRDADLVDAFKRMGAIPFVRTNVPQLCLRWANLHRQFMS